MIHSINGNVTVTVPHKHTSSSRNVKTARVVCLRARLEKNIPLGNILEMRGNHVR